MFFSCFSSFSNSSASFSRCDNDLQLSCRRDCKRLSFDDCDKLIQVALLQLFGIEKRFGATVALAGVDLAIESGEVHALIGENGAGKTTLLNIVAGLLRPDSGEIRGETAVA